MCGICGKVNFDKAQCVDRDLLRSMMASMHHRGPDDEGMYLSGNVGLGHRRLSIIDLNTGKQPIANEDDTVWIVFNGEIYNYQELRKELLGRGHRFRTETDTEVIIHAYEEYGEDFLSRLRGMFAFAIWDEKKRQLLLARDRVGIKPLYCCLSGKSLIFASEMKAILSDSAVPREINYPIIDRFLSYYYVPGSETLIKGIRKLDPGHYLLCKEGAVETRQYWDLEFPATPQPVAFAEAKERLMELLKEAVRLHMISDVPVGLLLSGGVDSSALLSLCIHESDKEISTFTIGFDGEGFDDERVYARIAANRYGTKHYETTISAAQFRDFLPEYVRFMEEPVCEPPAVALYYITKLAKEHVKVLISGEGGDEAFAGYPNHRNMLLLEKVKAAAGPLSGIVAQSLALAGYLAGDARVTKYAALMRLRQNEYYRSRTATPLTLFNRDYAAIYTKDFLDMIDKDYSVRPSAEYLANARAADPLNRMLYVDTKTWLPDDLLVKADKITMANSIELRVPLLDHVVLEYAASLPPEFKVNGTETKYILKRTFENIVPKEILNKKKTGFPVPYERWLGREMRDYVTEMLLDPATLGRGYFKKEAMETSLNGSKSASYSKEVFSLLVLELWHRTFIDGDISSQTKSN
jgi:asparagine synthase (glutamine-hydrolysing)